MDNRDELAISLNDLPEDIFKTIVNILNSIPKDIKNTQAYANVLNIDGSTKFEQLDWIFDEFPSVNVEAPETSINSWKRTDSVSKYIQEVINLNYDKRDKLILLLVHFESFLKAVFPTIKTVGPRKNYRKHLGSLNGMTVNNYLFVYVAAIVMVVYADTRNIENTIDRRLPHRNNILHNGIVDYENDELCKAYKCLVSFIAIIDLIDSEISARKLPNNHI